MPILYFYHFIAAKGVTTISCSKGANCTCGEYGIEGKITNSQFHGMTQRAFVNKIFCIYHLQVEDLISIELAYINTNHPDFVGGTRAAYESMTRRVSI